MSYFNHSFYKVFVGSTGTPLTSGNSSQLVAGQLGLFDYKTNAAFTAGNATIALHPMAYLAQGSYYPADKVSPFLGGFQESVKSKGINPNYVTRYWKVAGRTSKNHIVQIGYSGATNCVCPTFELNRTYFLRIDVKGSPALRAYHHHIYRTMSVYTGCDDPCSSSCSQTAQALDVFKKFADQINGDPQLSQFIQPAVVFKGQTAPSGSVGYITYQATQCDNGDALGLAAVQLAYSTFTVTLFSHLGSTSTYQIIAAATAAGPSNSQGGLTITWSVTATSYKVARKLCLTMPKTSDGTSNLSAIQTFYSGDASIVSGSIKVYGNATTSTTTTTSSTTSTTTTTTTLVAPTFIGCTEIFELTQLSSNIVNLSCEGLDTAIYTDVVSYKGYTWDVCPCEPADTTAYCVGLRLTGAYVDTKFGNCSFQPSDHFELEPIKIYVSFVDDKGNECTFQSVPVTEIQLPVQAIGTGEGLLRELIQFGMYRQEYWASDPRYREINKYPYLDVIDRNRIYNIYYVQHTVPRFNNPTGLFDSDQYTLVIAFPSTMTTTNFETLLTAYVATASVNGVALESF